MGRVGLPEIEFSLINGETNKYNPEDTGTIGLVQAVNIDAFEMYRGISKVHGSSRVSDYAGAAIASVNYFEAFDLDSNLQKQVLVLASGVLSRLNADKTFTPLASGLVNEPLCGTTYNNRIHFCSPNNTPFKVDVAGNVSRWGVLAPGLQETTVQTFDDATDWFVNVTNTIATNPHSSPDIVTSTGSLTLNKIDPTTSGVSVTTSGMGWDLSPVQSGVASFLVYIPGGAITSLAPTGTAVQMMLGSGTSNEFENSYRYNYTIGEFSEGWNLASAVLTDPDQITGHGVDLSDVEAARFSIFLKQPITTTASNFRLDHLYYTDVGTPDYITVTGANPPMVDETIRYGVSFVSRYGWESNMGPAGTAMLVSGTNYLSDLPISQDTQVIQRNIYRDLDLDETFLYVGSVYDNTTTTFIDDTPFESLGQTTPPLAGDATIDHTVPPRLRSATVWNNSIVGVEEGFPFRLQMSPPIEVEGFAPIHSVDLDGELLVPKANFAGMIVYGKESTYVFQGDSALTSVSTLLTPALGAVGRRAVERIKNYTACLNQDGPYLTYQTTGSWFLGDPIRGVFESEVDPNGLADAFVLHDPRRFRLIYFMKSSASGPTDIIYIWSYGKMGSGQAYNEGGGIDTLDARRGGWFKIHLPASINPQCAELVKIEENRPAVYIGGNDGYVYHLQDEDTYNYATGLTTTGVQMIIETGDVPFGQSADGIGFPRYLEINGNFTSTSSTTLRCTVEGREHAGGPVLSSSTFNVAFSGTSDVRTVGIPDNVWGQYGRVKVTNSGVGEGVQLKSLKVYYNPSKAMTGER